VRIGNRSLCFIIAAFVFMSGLIVCYRFKVTPVIASELSGILRVIPAIKVGTAG